MSVCLFDTGGRTKSCLCCYTDFVGAHWCLKEIRNIKSDGFSNVFVCSGQHCNFKLFYSSPTEFRVRGVHCCAFDHEGEYRRRVRHQFALDAIRESVTLRPRDIVNLVLQKTPMSEREKKSLHRFVAHRLSARGVKLPRTFADLVLPEGLDKIITAQRDIGDDKFLLYDSKIGDPSAGRILVFASYSMRQRAALAKEIYADGTYRAVSQIFATLYSIHTTIDGVSYPIFFILMPDERTETFTRAFRVIKEYMHAFGNGCVVHVDCQLSAINAFREAFECEVRICLFHQNQSVWKAVLRFGLAGAYNSISHPRLHIWIRRLLSYPFLPPDVILSEFERLFEDEALSGPFSVEEPFKDRFSNLVRYYKDFWLTRIPVWMWSQHSSTSRTNNVCEGFHNGLRQIIGIAHPNPFVTIQLLRRVDEEATRRFEYYLEGNVVKRIRKRSLELEEKIRHIIERRNKHSSVVDEKQFLDSISSAYLEYYHNEKLARRDISLNVVTMSKQHMDEVAHVLDEQNRYDPLEDSFDDQDFIERDAATEIIFDSVVDTTVNGEVMMEIDEESHLNDCQDVCDALTRKDVRWRREKQKEAKRANVTKPRRRRNSLMRGLEKAREEARSKQVRRLRH